MAEQVSGTSYPPPGRPRHTVGLVPGPVPPEYKGTENLKAEQRAAREPLKSTDPIMQPAVEPASIIFSKLKFSLGASFSRAGFRTDIYEESFLTKS